MSLELFLIIGATIVSPVFKLVFQYLNSECCSFPVELSSDFILQFFYRKLLLILICLCPKFLLIDVFDDFRF